MSELTYHMLKRIDHLNLGDQLAIGQEYREWIKCLESKNLVPQNILFINTLNYGINIPYQEFVFFNIQKIS